MCEILVLLTEYQEYFSTKCKKSYFFDKTKNKGTKPDTSPLTVINGKTTTQED